MMKKHITWQEVSDLSVALQNEIISLLKENNLDELELKSTTKDRKMPPMFLTIMGILTHGRKRW